MKAVIYARYSSDNQREESIEGQIRECTEFAVGNNIEIVGTYIDRAFTGKVAQRPDFQKMIADSSQKIFDYVIVWKLDRFSRDKIDSAIYKMKLKDNGVKVISATEGITDTPEGTLLEGMLETMAQYFSEDLSVKTLRGMTENALKCKYNGGSVPLGFKIDSENHYQIDPVLAPVVVDIFTKYKEGYTIRKLVEELNLKGIKTNRGTEIKSTTISNILHNRKYIGEYQFSKVKIENGIPPIVPVELFEAVQEKMATNKKAPARYKAEEEYLLTTKLFCGNCNSPMVGECGKNRKGIVYRYYKCSNAKHNKGCKRKAVKKAWIEDYVIEFILKFAIDDDLIEKVTDSIMEYQKKDNSIIPVLEKQLSDINKGIENMLNAIQAGIITNSTRERLDNLEKSKSEIETKISKEKAQNKKVTRKQLRDWFDYWKNADVKKIGVRRALINNFINSIYLFEDKIVIILNYKDGTKKVELEQKDKVRIGSFISSMREPQSRVAIVTLFFLYLIYCLYEPILL